MERRKNALWHRCGTCGTIFLSIPELRAHTKTHESERPMPASDGQKRPMHEGMAESLRDMEKTS